ncbi:MULTISPECIES: ThiF family adenylyltransferase [unclassified Delftia]|uniref:ThiF family adenylyltransferase n=1 Tax=unclassified Delftia TaxID=2613839 RepID=UPI0019020396|nr:MULTISPECIES: ThiF family adenylyltransferase [unclassified Delftia]MBK0116117.1 ThiF family adenylyltransferase [Delftia sp. S65]MBK0121982.1 ThiF family adenylyltransferase [Delftia sp. S67]MBK0132582.1 ThiF family adenylyltransferase [Delftia sp. S66]
MSRKLISLNPELQRLLDEGYELDVRENHLLLHSVPYVNERREVARGIIVAPITLATPDKLGRPGSHQVYFVGEHPYRADGSILIQVQHASGDYRLTDGINAQHHFSNKPRCGFYESFYEQLTSYARVIGNEAKAIDPAVDARTFKPREPVEEDSVFKYEDTASSRAGIRRLAMRFRAQRVAIVGLGGTGSYALDLIAKTHVAEIHLFDGDVLRPHNAFRIPGAVPREDLERELPKVQYLAERYGCMRHGIVAHTVMLDEDNVHLLTNFDYVFLCVDKGEVRQLVLRKLHDTQVVVIDVGMGLQLSDDQETIWGSCRVTSSTPSTRELAKARIPKVDRDEELYASNIQIAELNSLNAALAVAKWKRMTGFYLDDHGEYETTYSVNLNQLSRQEPPA